MRGSIWPGEDRPLWDGRGGEADTPGGKTRLLSTPVRSYLYSNQGPEGVN